MTARVLVGLLGVCGLLAAPASAAKPLVGAATHPTWGDTSHGVYDRVVPAMTAMGARVLRAVDAEHWQALELAGRLREAGIAAIVTVPDRIPDTRWADAVDRLIASGVRVVAVEGLNEPDLFKQGGSGENWPAYARSHQHAAHALWDARGWDAAGVELLAPSIGHEENYPRLVGIQGLATVANLHSYPGAAPASATDAARRAANARALAGAQRLWVTETGYEITDYVTDAKAAAWYPPLLDTLRGVGAEVIVCYALVDTARPLAGLVWTTGGRRWGVYSVDATGAFQPRAHRDAIRTWAG